MYLRHRHRFFVGSYNTSILEEATNSRRIICLPWHYRRKPCRYVIAHHWALYTCRSCPRVELGVPPPITDVVITRILTQRPFNVLFLLDPATLQVVRDDPCRVGSNTVRCVVYFMPRNRVAVDEITNSSGSPRIVVNRPRLSVTQIFRQSIKIHLLDDVEEL